MGEADWWSQILIDPEDQLTWSAFADWWEELGKTAEAAAARSTSQHKPSRDNACILDRFVKYSYDWWEEFNSVLSRCYRVPAEVFRRLSQPLSDQEDWDSLFREYLTPLDAYQELFHAYTEHYRQSIQPAAAVAAHEPQSRLKHPTYGTKAEAYSALFTAIAITKEVDMDREEKIKAFLLSYRKCPRDTAVYYLEQCNWNLNQALEVYWRNHILIYD